MEEEKEKKIDWDKTVARNTKLGDASEKISKAVISILKAGQSKTDLEAVESMADAVENLQLAMKEVGNAMHIQMGREVK